VTGPFGTEREARELPEVRILGQVRARLAAFDWEHDDRQCALKDIDQIVNPPGGADGTPAAPGATLTVAQLATVLTALADAETYRMREAAEFCGECEIHPAGACEDHLDDVAAAQAYNDLTAELGGGAE
jgi:hypothetical protein